MSAEPSSNLPVLSPPGSGRSSPAPRSARNAAEEPLYKKDKGFRRYAAGVERALALWDSAQQEWADYISFLARLLKALQSHPPEISVIPHSDAVTLRLAQCLNPALPSGVHQKALEVYGYIFSIIGKDVLARDLHLYFPGLASVLSFASLSVRPLFLSVLEDHVLKLDEDAIRPALKAIILSLLPGLEDDTSEDFERMVSALDKLREAAGGSSHDVADGKAEGSSSHFWQCFFLATITNTSRRQGALAFLARRLPKFGVSKSPMPASTTVQGLSFEAESAISPEPGLLIRCFASGLSDSQLLIQRGFLDLIVSHLPLDSPVLQERISKGDLERLVAAAASVVSRRDMSLNRRLWAWFVGPESIAPEGTEGITSPMSDKHNTSANPSTHQAAYFSRYGLEALTNSVLKMINRRSTAPAERARPFRVCLSLMDRWEVGGLIVPEVFLPALQSIQSYSEDAPRESVAEVMRSASAFFDGVDSGLIWGKLIHLVISSLQDNRIPRDEALRQIKLAKFVLARFNLKEEDMLLYHMPLMALSTLACLNETSELTTKSAIDPEIIALVFEAVDAIIQLIPDRAFKEDAVTGNDPAEATDTPRASISQQIRTFYDESQGSLEVADPPFQLAQLGQLALREASVMFAASIKSSDSILPLEMSSKVLASLIIKTRQLKALEKNDPADIIQQALLKTTSSETCLPFPHLSAMTAVLVALQTSPLSESYVPPDQLSELVYLLINKFWVYLSPLMPKYHVESTRCMLQLHTIAPNDRIVEAAISSIIVEQLSQKSAVPDALSCGRYFATLWTHTMYELSMQSERRVSTIRRANNEAPISSLPSGELHTILTRPLLLLLDTLAEDKSDTAAFMRTWLQDLPSLNKIFEILTLRLRSLRCLSSTNSLLPESAHEKAEARPPKDDTKACLYYLQHIHNILKRQSHFTWIMLAEAPTPWTEDSSTQTTLQVWLVCTCLSALILQSDRPEAQVEPHIHELHRTSVSIISQIYRGPAASPLRELELEVPLMVRLRTAGPSLQSLILIAELSALRLRIIGVAEAPPPEPKIPNRPTHRSRLSLTMIKDPEDHEPAPVAPPPQLIECLKYGFSSPNSRLVLDDWVQFLIDVLPMFADTIFQNLLPLVECFCKQITVTFEQLKATFTKDKTKHSISPESTLISLINGLEQILAKAHERLTDQETKALANKSPEQPQGFFSNVVSGVFSSDTNQTRTPTANSRLTVLLCFQDTVRICFAIWSWGGYGQMQGQQDPTSASSFGYTSLRMRNRARRILEHLFAAEALECLETLVVLWAGASQDDVLSTSITGLLNVLNGSKPKHTIPAIFNAVYSRTDPGALDASRVSSLTSDLSDADLVTFLVAYTQSLEDDAMDEIWQDCTVFLRDVLANPLPHRQILPSLLEFTAVIGGKIDNTNFGEQRRTRRDLADIFARILTAIFTTRSMGYLQDTNQIPTTEKASAITNGGHAQKRASDVVSILNTIVPRLSIILVENDRVAKVATDVSTSVIGPTFRAKAFPDNVSKNTLDLLQGLTKIAPTNKSLKKDIYDAFNDPKFFTTPLELLKEAWLPILAQWTQSDKDRLPELLSRLSAPTTAGIMFGVGATSARQEADRKTQLTLRRIALLILSGPEDASSTNVPQILEKVVELLTATPASSPSSVTRAEVIVLIRSVILKTSPVHLASLWPVVNGELTSALSSLLPNAANKDHYNNSGIIQICKLLDELVVLDPDDFQLIEWLFISDTIDAVYKPSKPPPLASLTDEVNEVLALASPAPTVTPHLNNDPRTDEAKMLLLDPMLEACEKEEGTDTLNMTKGELTNRILRPFLGNLALHAFESRYRGGMPDWQGVWDSVVKDAAS